MSQSCAKGRVGETVLQMVSDTVLCCALAASPALGHWPARPAAKAPVTSPEITPAAASLAAAHRRAPRLAWISAAVRSAKG